MSETNEIKTCVDCGQEFEITEGWKKLIEENPNIKLPTRCYKCRQKRKAEKEENNNLRSRW